MNINSLQLQSPVVEKKTKLKNKKIVVVGIVIFISLLICLFLSLFLVNNSKNKTNQDSSEDKQEDKDESEVTLASKLPQNWNIISNANCGVDIPFPPKKDPYYVEKKGAEPYSPLDYEGSGKYWNYFENTSDSPDLFETGINILFKADNEPGSGFVPGVVVIRCSSNRLNWTLEEFIKEVEKRYNNPVSYPDFEEINIASKVKEAKWSNDVYILRYSGGFYDENQSYYYVATKNFIYEIHSVAMMDREIVKETVKTIFDNLEFSKTKALINTFTNLEYDFKFNFPKGFTQFGSISANALNPNEIVTLSDSSELSYDLGSKEAWDGFSVNVDSNKENLSLEEYINKVKVDWIETCKEVDGEECELEIKNQKYIINGSEAFYTTGWKSLTLESAPINVYIKNSKSSAILILTPAQKFNDFEEVYRSVKIIE